METPQRCFLFRHGLVVLHEGYVRDLFAEQKIAPDFGKIPPCIAKTLRNN